MFIGRNEVIFWEKAEEKVSEKHCLLLVASF
nr:MAG TPA: hypothetical protein [Caudoviricetes sp.]